MFLPTLDSIGLGCQAGRQAGRQAGLAEVSHHPPPGKGEKFSAFHSIRHFFSENAGFSVGMLYELIIGTTDERVVFLKIHSSS